MKEKIALNIIIITLSLVKYTIILCIIIILTSNDSINLDTISNILEKVIM